MMRIASRMQSKSRITRTGFYQDIGLFWVQFRKRSGTVASYDGQWDRTANKMVQQFKETGHPIFTATSALSREILKQRKGRSTIHFNGEFMNTELLFQTINSVNQGSICAVTNGC